MNHRLLSLLWVMFTDLITVYVISKKVVKSIEKSQKHFDTIAGFYYFCTTT